MPNRVPPEATFLESLTTRTKEFFLKRVHPFWRDVLCADPTISANIIPLMLTGIFMRLSELVEVMGASGNDWNMTPYEVQPGEPTRIIEHQADGRSRRVVIWVDSAVALPFVVMRVGTSTGSVAAGGFQIVPGQMNEIGRIPAKKQLYVSTDVPLRIFVIEEV